MHLLQVGQPYIAGRDCCAPGTNYNYRAGTHELLLLIDRPTPAEITAVKTGACEFGLVIYQRVVFFLYRFEGGFAWSDCPYSIWLLPARERIAPEPGTPETRALLQVLLVDAASNTVRALRAVTLAPALTAALHAAITEQLREQISIAEYEAAIASADRKWPDSKAMVAAAIVRAGGI